MREQLAHRPTRLLRELLREIVLLADLLDRLELRLDPVRIACSAASMRVSMFSVSWSPHARHLAMPSLSAATALYSSWRSRSKRVP
jgi:hypothetical protein